MNLLTKRKLKLNSGSSALKVTKSSVIIRILKLIMTIYIVTFVPSSAKICHFKWKIRKNNTSRKQILHPSTRLSQ